MIICLDLETTGLDERFCGIVEIGAVVLDSGEEFHRICRPHLAQIEPEALKTNGLTEEAINDKARMPEALALFEFIGWARGRHGDRTKIQIAGWNIHFDHRFLLGAARKHRLENRWLPFAHRLIDIHSILAFREMQAKATRWASQAIPLRLDLLGNEVENCDRASRLLDLPEEPKPHTALAGAKQIRAMLRRLLGDVGVLP